MNEEETEAGTQTAEKGPIKAEMQADGANAGLQQRRAELVSRLQKVNNKSGVKPKFDASLREFTVQDPATKRSKAYVWQAVDAAAGQSNPTSSVEASTAGYGSNWPSSELSKLLENHGITMDSFGKSGAKSFEELHQEIRQGRSMLLIDATRYKSLVRVVPILLVRIAVEVGGKEQFLICQGKDGKHVLPAMKKQPHETMHETAARIISDMGWIDADIEFDYDKLETTEQDEHSPSFPNMRTVYKKDIVPGRIKAPSTEVLKKFGVQTEEADASFQASVDGFSYSCKWMTEEACTSCQESGVQLYATEAGADLSSLVYPPVGLPEDELTDFLIDEGVDLSQWGQGKYKSLSECSQDLVRGKAMLVKMPDGRMVRQVDVVLLEIRRTDRNEILYQIAEGSAQGDHRPPGVSQLCGEHPFWAARRLIKNDLGLPEDQVELDPTTVVTKTEIQDSTAFYGLQTSYRKLTIKATFKV